MAWRQRGWVGLILAVSAYGQLNYTNLKIAGTALGRADCIPGADISGCLNAVLGQSSNQTIAIDPGTYSITGIVNLAQNQMLIGTGSNGATSLFFQGTGELVFGTSTNAGSGGLRHLQLTTNNSPVGIQINGHNLYFEDVSLTGFGTAVQFGGNTFESMFRNMLFQLNGTAISAPVGSSGGERMVISNCEFTGNQADINDQIGFEWMIDNSSFDQTANLSIAINGVASAQPGHLRISHSHFEPVNQLPLGGFISVTGPVTINVQDSTFLTATTTGTNPAFIVASPQAQVNVTGGFAFSTTTPLCLARGGQSVWLQGVTGGTNVSIDPSVCGMPSAVHRKISNMFGGPDMSSLW